MRKFQIVVLMQCNGRDYFESIISHKSEKKKNYISKFRKKLQNLFNILVALLLQKLYYIKVYLENKEKPKSADVTVAYFVNEIESLNVAYYCFTSWSSNSF